MIARQIPTSYKALLFTSATDPATITTLPTPPLTASTALVRPLLVNVVSYIRNIFANNNPRGLAYPLPIVPGGNTIGRLLAAAADAPTLDSNLTPAVHNALVFVDPVLRAQDGSAVILRGLSSDFSPEGAAVMATEWRHGAFAEVLRAPAANVHLLKEARLLGPRGPPVNGLGYRIEDLSYIAVLAIPYGGLRDVDLSAGETVVIAPATGGFGSAAVSVALALGANVIAMGRNAGSLEDLQANATKAYPASSGRLRVVRTTGTDATADQAAIQSAASSLGARGGRADVYFDISPAAASGSSHTKAGILSLRRNGRVSLMGGIRDDDIGLPYAQIMLRGLRIQGTFMYTRAQIQELIRLVESGVIRLGEEAGVRCNGVFGLEEWEEAFRVAAEEAGVGRYVLMAPQQGKAMA